MAALGGPHLTPPAAVESSADLASQPAPSVHDSPSPSGISSRLRATRRRSSAAADRRRASASRFAQLVPPWKGRTRWDWWWPGCGAAVPLFPAGAPSAFLPVLLPYCAPRKDSRAPVAGGFSPVPLSLRRTRSSRKRCAFCCRNRAARFSQILLDVAAFVQLAALHFGARAEHALDPGAQCFRAVDHEQVAALRAQAARHQVFQQFLDHGGVLRRSLPQPQHVFFPAGFDAQRHHQHLFAEMNPVDQQGHRATRSRPPSLRSQSSFNCAALACTNSRLMLLFCSSRCRSRPERIPPRGDSSACSTRRGSLPAPRAAAARRAATAGSSAKELPGLHVCAPAAVPPLLSLRQTPHTPAAGPSARSRIPQSADSVVPRAAALRLRSPLG